MLAAPPRCRLPALVQAVLWFRRPIELMDLCRRYYGDVFTMRLPDLGDIVMVCSPDDIRRVFTGDPEVLHAGEGNAPLGPALGQSSMLLLDGRAHARHRRLLMPAFHGERMAALATSMSEIAARAVDAWPRGRPFAVHPSMQDVTLDVMLRTVFGVEERAELDALRLELKKFLELTSGPLAPFFLVPWLQKDFGAWSPWSRFCRQRSASDALIYQLIAARRRAPRGDKSDVLGMLLDAVDEDGSPMSDVELRDELVTLLIAGHETTAAALAWAFERILAHPAVHRRLRDEVDEAFAGAAAGHGAPALLRLEYLDATIKEVLRLRPVVPVVVRKVKKPFELGRYRIPEGVRLAPCIHAAQRDRRAWPEPERFMPERFLDKKVDPYSWLPFGGGPRRCIGMAFALFEMKVVLASAIHRLDLDLAEPAPVRLSRRSITFVPASGTLLYARSRRLQPEIAVAKPQRPSRTPVQVEPAAVHAAPVADAE